MSKEKAMELLIAISQIEGYLIGIAGLQRPAIVYDNIDKIVKELIYTVQEKNDEME